MRTRILVPGILVLLGGLAAHYLAPWVFNGLSSSFIFTQAPATQASGYSSGIYTDNNLGQILSGVKLLAKITDIASIATIIVGICIIPFGLFAMKKSTLYHKTYNKTGSAASEILKQRLAKGEIDITEYKTLVKYLRN